MSQYLTTAAIDIAKQNIESFFVVLAKHKGKPLYLRQY